jgi:chemotaxis protein methyltransferase CheR
MQDAVQDLAPTFPSGPPAPIDPHEAEAIAALSGLVQHQAGLQIGPTRHAMVRSRLARRLRHLGLPSLAAYWQLVSSNPSAEMPHLISSLTTNVSSFFREPHHLDLLDRELRTRLLPGLRPGMRLRLWSAGCAHGQEAYSMAMILSEAGAQPNQGDIRILATDIDPEALAVAARGTYGDAMLTGVSQDRRARHFKANPGGSDWTVGSHLRAFLTFRELNLVRPLPMRGPFDVIFCRNVMIYFDDSTQLSLCRNLARLLAPGGLLCIGHSERIADVLAPHFDNIGLTAYRRTTTPLGSDLQPTGRIASHGPA